MLFRSVQRALNKIVGAYAIAVIEKSNPDRMIVARKSSPLVIGIGENEYFIASDASPIVEYTNKVVYLKDEEVAIIDRNEPLHILDLNNIEVNHEISQLDLSI